MSSLDAIQRIRNDYSFRDLEIETISAMLDLSYTTADDSSAQTPLRASSLIIYGPTQTAKSSITHALLQSSNAINYTIVDCQKCISQRALYEFTIDQILQRTFVVDEDGTVTHDTTSIETLDAFLLVLERTLMEPEHADRIVIFDHFSASRFDDAEDIMRATIGLFERLDGTARTAVFIVSEYNDIPHYPVPSIQFGAYTSDQLLEIIKLGNYGSIDLEEYNIDAAEDLLDLWHKFCKTFISASQDIIGGDLLLYGIIARKMFPKYLQPLKEGILTAKNHTQLARSAGLSRLLDPEPWIAQEESVVQEPRKKTANSTKMTELSVSARYLLLASFLASYNPEKTDRTFFSRGKGEKTKRRAGKNAANKVTKQPQRVLGPKGFTIERMISIFHAIVPNQYPHTAVLDQQIATLSSKRLILKQGSGSDLLDDGKWIVNIKFDMIMKVAQSVEFELYRFLVSE